MYLSDRDLRWAIECGKLLVDPPPKEIGSSSIDLHLDTVEEAKVWDMQAFNEVNISHGHPINELPIGQFDYRTFSKRYLCSPSEDSANHVFRRGQEIVIKQNGLLLWQTKEWIGTPEKDADLICFIDGKSTKSRAGIIVHLTAPTIHTSWSGNITLEIANVGPFHLVLKEDDVIAQLTVAKTTSVPSKNMKETGSITFGQTSV